MKSLDANILVYAFNREADEHPKAKLLLDTAIEKPDEWILADQALFEFYAILRNPAILPRPIEFN